MKPALTLIKDFNRTDAVFELYDLTSYPHSVFLKKKLKSHNFVFYNFSDKIYDLNYLKSLPVATLGYELSQFYEKNKYSPVHLEALLRNSKKIDDVSLHMTLMHDILHVLTGYSTSAKDEACLQAFSYHHLRLPAAILISIGYLIPNIFSGHFISSTKKIYAAHKSGKAAKWLLPVKWNEYLNKNLQQIRNEFQITTKKEIHERMG